MEQSDYWLGLVSVSASFANSASDPTECYWSNPEIASDVFLLNLVEKFRRVFEQRLISGLSRLG